mmetsp:Transcript_102753/g.295871  ORF Transcript_102753/g.295871 Transcript_102753/m.295871 type:complete len:837 (-) Transcript_102753:87-2597(-)
MRDRPRPGLLRWLTAALAPAALAKVPPNQPFQVVRPTQDHTSMLPVVEGLQQLAQHEARIALVSVVGPYHSGKSFLLNALAGETNVFSIGRQTSPETMGIWLCRTEMRASDGAEVWLMDSEGFFGPGVSESYDAKIFTIASLLGGHLVYNTVKIIDQQAVSLLEMLARRAQLFRTRSSAEPFSGDTPDFLSVRSFPPLTWVVEDFVQELPEQHRLAEDGATAWLRSYLSRGNGSDLDPDNDGRPFLAKLYRDFKVHTLFLPATTKEHLVDLSKLSWSDLTPEFQQELQELKTHILSNLQAREFEGKSMRGSTLDRSIRFIVQALQRGMFHELPSLWATWTTQVAEMSLQDAEAWFSNLLSQIDMGEDPIAIADFNSHVEKARGRSKEFYKELLRDFDMRPEYTRLGELMDKHFQHKLLLYHERIQRWVQELIAESKDVMMRTLMKTELPVDPATLLRSGEVATRSIVQDFASRLHSFAQRGPAPSLGKAAMMPAFSQDPVSQLTTDLRSLLGARELENEREIAQYFKAAVVAADEAVEAELKMHTGKLIGMARMKELTATVAARCGEAFDERLAKHEWMKSLSHYRTHKALVQTETFDSKMSRFTAANEQRLSSHFSAALERCLTSYRSRKGNLPMPVSEADLESEHRALAASVRELLDEQAGQGGELRDTVAYKGVLRNLDAVIEEGAHYARQKNVELWKVHSDEATRCALRENEAKRRQCGLTCMFNKVPGVHRSTCKENLMRCLSRSGAGSRMSPQMQNQVFENWYNKDLAADVSAVYTNFYFSSGLVGALVLFVGLGWRRSGRPSAGYGSPYGAGAGAGLYNSAYGAGPYHR